MSNFLLYFFIVQIKQLQKSIVTSKYFFEGDMKKFLIQHEHEFINNTNCGDASEDDLNSRLLLQWAFHIAKGMQYLARMHIMHGDLAARNILIGTGRNVTFACFYFSTTF